MVGENKADHPQNVSIITSQTSDVHGSSFHKTKKNDGSPLHYFITNNSID